MPAFVIVNSAKHGEAIDGIMCDPSITGYPDRRSDVKVKVTIGDQRLTIDNEPQPREIISCIGENGVTTYCVDGSTNQLRNRELRVTLEKAARLLEQFHHCVWPVKRESRDPEFFTDGLATLFDWIRQERLRLTGMWDRHDDTNERSCG